MSEFIVGRNPVLEAIRAKREIHKILIAEGSQKGAMQEIFTKARDEKIIVQIVPRIKLDQMHEHHQGVLALIAAHDYVELDDILDQLNGKANPLIVVLDEIEDPHNLGSILRSSNAVGVDVVIIPNRHAVGLTVTVAKSSAGAIEYVPVARVTNLVQTIQKLKEKGFWVIGADGSGKMNYDAMQVDMPLVLVIGSEGSGISPLLLKQCDFVVSLPMRGQVSSLNAGVAAGILLYEIDRKRHL
jgi:23S rRNA (guanosine2251-2'-O)-methyltransferase